MLGLDKKQTVTLLVLLSGTFIAVLNQTLVTPMFPTIMAEMSIGASTAQWLTTGFTLVNAIMVPITAFLTDRFDTKSLFLSAMGIFTAGCLCCAFSVNFAMLLIGRMIQAAGAGILMPMVMTVFMLTFSLEKRGQAMGLYGLVISFAPAIGPTVSGLMIDHFGWRIIFGGISVLACIGFLCAVLVLDRKDSAASKTARLDKLSVVLSSFGFGFVLYGFSSIGSYGANAVSFAAVAIGAVILVFFFRRQMRIECPMLRVDILKNRRFAAATVISMVVQAALMANSVLLPIYIQDLSGHTATVSGLVMLPGAIVSGAMGPVAGRIFDKRGPRKLVIVGTAALALFTLPFMFVNESTPILLLCFFFIMRNFALSMVNMPVHTWGTNALDNELLNHGNALHNTLRQVAGSFGTALVVSVYSIVQASLSAEYGATQSGIYAFNAAFGVQLIFCIAAFVLAVICVKAKASDAAQQDPSRKRIGVLASVMKTDVFFLNEHDTVGDAVLLFVKKGISAAPIVDDSGKPVGIISDGDLIRALSRRNRTYMDPITMMITSELADPEFDERVASIMGKPVTSIATMNLVSIDAHSTFDEACRVLGDNHLKKAPVVEDGRLIGVINRSDVIMYALKLYVGKGQVPVGN